MRVIAIPGSGKTFSLVQRLIRLIQQGVPGEDPVRDICEQGSKGDTETGVHAGLHSEKPNITTFNALGMKILRENEDTAGKVTLATKIRVTELILELLSDERTGRLQTVPTRTCLASTVLLKSCVPQLRIFIKRQGFISRKAAPERWQHGLFRHSPFL